MSDPAALLAAFEDIRAAAAAAKIPLRLTGSIAVQQACPVHAPLAQADRDFADLDLVGYKRDGQALNAMFGALGYTANREVFALSEGTRAIFDHARSRLHVDVFFDRLEFCHRIDLKNRLETRPITIPLAELLLTKLQIIKINAKDLADACVLLLEHDFAGEAGHIATLCAAEWGFWRTVTGNLEKLADYAAASIVFAPYEARLRTRINSLSIAIDAAPKPLAFRLRARVGDRMKWYNDVDEVD
jgi:hypothetical protein